MGAGKVRADATFAGGWTMKARMRIALLIFLLGCLMYVPAFADTTCFLEELGMEITLPGDCQVVTRQSVDDYARQNGIDGQSLLNELETRNCYLDAWIAENEAEIAVTMVTSKDFSAIDMRGWNDALLLSLGETTKQQMESMGAVCGEIDLYDQSQTKFLRTPYQVSDDQGPLYGFEYCTYLWDQCIRVALLSRETIGPDQKELLRQVVDSIRFDHLSAGEEAGLDTPSFSCTDPDSGVSFTVPSNWSAAALADTSEHLDQKFTYNGDTMVQILFTAQDLDQGPVGNNAITEQDVAAMFDCAPGDVSRITFAGKEYYAVEQTTRQSLYGMEISLPQIILIRLQNGWLYAFQLIGATRESARYQDFATLMESVRYPETGTLLWSGSAADFLLGLLVTVSLYSLPVVLYRFFLRKEPVERKKAKKITWLYGIGAFAVMVVLLLPLRQTAVASAAFFWSWVNYRILIFGEEKPSVEPVPVFCRRCGARLEPGSVFCRKCGTRVAPDFVDCKKE